MKKIICSLIVIAVIASGLALAGEPPAERLVESRVIHGGPATMAKTVVDTINLMSTRRDHTNGPGEPTYYGDFQDADGHPAWNGWTSQDLSQPTTHHWQVSNYQQADPGNLVAWCGDLAFPACDTTDVAGGYGNGWHQQLAFQAAVPDNGLPATVNVTATLENDTEPGYDYTYLSYQYEGQFLADITSWDGKGTIAVNGTVTYQPGEFVDGIDVRLLFRFKSDSGWSDEDCQYPTAGAMRIDDITVTILQTGYADQVHFEDFQGGDLNLGDGMGDDGSYLWRVVHPTGVGDFAKIWTGLKDIDICVENWSPQVAFIDDGLVVPGTGGTPCTTWCYGPGGYIVNHSGGLAGPGEHLHNRINSPVMDIPDPAYTGVVLDWLQYQHEQLGFNSPGMYIEWSVRSADTDGDGGQGIQDIVDQPWVNRGFLSGVDDIGYTHEVREVSDLMVGGWDQLQVTLGVFELGWFWGWVGTDGTPAPYFDNVRVKLYPTPGPAMSAREVDLANDGFPERGSLDYGDLGSHHVRFDMARSIAPAEHMRVDHGDSIVVRINPTRQGAELNGTPQLHYLLLRNPLFDPYRTASLPDAGNVAGVPAVHPSGTVSDDKWAFDLPDTGFLFPGDILHYYVRAEDAVGGADIRASIVPPDTSGFSSLYEYADYVPDPYDDAFAFRALPTITEDGFGGYETPPVLIWNDYENRGMNKWLHATRVTFYGPGESDFFYTNGALSGVGNGLGGKAQSHENLPYTDIVYGSGDLSANTLSHGDFWNDPSDDIGVLTAWFQTGGKDLFLAGDQLATNLSFSTEGLAFLTDVMGVEYLGGDLRTFIENQRSPQVLAGAGNPVFQNVASWVVFGGCPGLNPFDVIQAGPQAQRLAEYADPTGAGGAYPYAAGVLHIPPTPGTSRVVYTPYDLGSIVSDPDAATPPLAARAYLLRDVKSFFGIAFDPVVLTDTPEALQFAAANHPNPFNPATKIVYTVPKAGHLSLKVYDIRGMLVKTLVDGRVEAGADQVAVWDGTDQAGSAVSSGVYFYEARTGAEVKVGKMALLK